MKRVRWDFFGFALLLFVAAGASVDKEGNVWLNLVTAAVGGWMLSTAFWAPLLSASAQNFRNLEKVTEDVLSQNKRMLTFINNSKFGPQALWNPLPPCEPKTD